MHILPKEELSGLITGDVFVGVSCDHCWMKFLSKEELLDHFILFCLEFSPNHVMGTEETVEASSPSSPKSDESNRQKKFYIAGIVLLAAVAVGVSIALIVETTKYDGICTQPATTPAYSYSSWKTYGDSEIEVICSEGYRFSNGSKTVILTCRNSAWNTTNMPSCISVIEAVEYTCRFLDEELGYNATFNLRRSGENSGEGTLTGLTSRPVQIISFNSTYCWPTQDRTTRMSNDIVSQQSYTFPNMKVNVSDAFDVRIRSIVDVVTVVTFEQTVRGEYVSDVYTF